MSMTDPIADMLTRIRNANTVRRTTVDIPGSKVKRAIAQILKEEGFIESYQWIPDSKQGTIRIRLRYSDKDRVISGLRRISKPGLRVYAKKGEIPRVLGGLGVAVLSTSRGIMTDRQARREGVGGEVLCYIW
ncbi:MAG: 30S ribosomal protein S8 [Clostridia bacterium]|nr:30S ribosomal protein S8 [Clostridia bacterium]